jgi:feruloyl esterase
MLTRTFADVRRFRRLVSLVFMSTLGCCASAQAAAPADGCAALARLHLPGVTITATESFAAGQYRAPQEGMPIHGIVPGMRVTGAIEDPATPAFCRVAGTIRPSPGSVIKFEVWLPRSGWNGKFLGIGNFGWGGALMLSSMPDGLAKGYAVASTDTGHDGTAPDGQGGRFALGHPEKLVDYAYRADHLMTIHSKAIVKAFYGRAPERSYWIGCSLGGIEGLIEAKRYPADYDGIVVGAPPNPLVSFNAAQLWPGWLVHQHPDWKMTRSKFEMLAKAMISACAGPVGRRQGFIEEPDKCTFEPRQLQCKGEDRADCLTTGQVQLMEHIYQGPVDPRTGRVIFPGPAKGSEAELPVFADDVPFVNALDLFRFAAFGDLAWDGKTIDWDRDIAAANARIGSLFTVDANLRPFFDRGGKLLLYIGWNDYHNPKELIDYYQSLRRNAGLRGRDSVRLFTLPGVGHCAGGAGCDTFNKLGAIDDWATTAKPPVRLVALKISGGKAVRTRPICSYPQTARYKGVGSIDDASSFSCED